MHMKFYLTHVACNKIQGYGYVGFSLFLQTYKSLWIKSICPMPSVCMILCSYRTFAYVDLASELDLTKTLSLSGNKFLDLPLRISKAKLKDEKEKKKKKRVKATAEDKAGNTMTSDQNFRILIMINVMILG